MAKKIETSKKRPAKPFRGAVDGVPFSKDNQPKPEAKSKGWGHWRKQRHLTQAIITAMVGKDGKPKKAFGEYVNSLIENAKAGNPKAIETLNKSMEDQEAIKIALNIPLISFDPLSDIDDTANDSTS